MSKLLNLEDFRYYSKVINEPMIIVVIAQSAFMTHPTISRKRFVTSRLSRCLDSTISGIWYRMSWLIPGIFMD